MRILDKRRSLLQKVKELTSKAITWFADRGIIEQEEKSFLAAQSLIIKLGEVSKRLHPEYKSELGANNIFNIFRAYRNLNAHSELEAKTIIKMLDRVGELKNTAEKLILQTPHNSLTLNTFENFSGFSTKENKTKLVDGLISKLNDEEDAPLLPNEIETTDYSIAIAEITNHQDLISVTKSHEAVSLQVAEDIISWAEQTKRKLESDNRFAKEEELFKTCTSQRSDKLLKIFGGVNEFLRKEYSIDELNVEYFRKEFTRLKSYKNGEDQFRRDLAAISKGAFRIKGNIRDFIQSESYKSIEDSVGLTNDNFDSFFEEANRKLIERKEDLKNNFIESWKNAFILKKRKYELEQLQKEREIFCNSLYKKIEEFKKLKSLLSLFTNDVRKLWDLSGGVWKDIDLSIIQKYANILQNEKSIIELSDLLGKLRDAQKEYEIEKVRTKILKQDYKIEYGHKSEMIGIHESNDISSAISSEVALLGNVDTEIVFYQKFAENKLLTFQYQHKYLESLEVEEEVEEQKLKRKNKGPFIICVDTSSSMIGYPEQIAKVLSFALVKTAIRDNRKCYLISFTTSIKTIELTNISRSLDKMVEFLSTVFNGGTDAAPALNESLNLLKTKDFENADVIMISDFQIGTLPEPLIRDIALQKTRGTKFNSLIISKTVTSHSMDIFDNNWIYNTSQEGSMIQLVKDISVII